MIPNAIFSPARRPVGRRRGMALVLILGMLAVTVAVSYSLMRTQAQTALLQTNTQTSNTARQAAQAGLARAIRTMHDDAWGGVGTTLTGSCDAQSSYSVTFAAGDAALLSGDPNYSEYPFRVTITSIGSATNPSNPSVATKHTVSAVVQLIRRALNESAKPASWDTMNGFTLYQWNANATAQTVNVDFPVHVTGDVCLYGDLRLAVSYPGSTSVANDYFTGLKSLFLNNGFDARPFSGKIQLGTGRTTVGNRKYLSDYLGLTYVDAAPPGVIPVAYPTVPSSYQLYAGGPTYTVPPLQTTYGSNPMGQSIGSNTTTNPLGLYSNSGTLSLGTGTTFTGVLFASGATDEVRLTGSGTQLLGANLPLLHGSTQVYQLPTVIAKNDVVVKSGTNSTVTGLVMAWDQFLVETGTKTTMLNFSGRVFSDDLDLMGRTEWNIGSPGWTNANTFWKLGGSLVVFPMWMQTSYNLQIQPTINLQPTTGVSYHWPNWSQPIYTKAAGDSGLKWNIVSWSDGG